MSTLIPARPGGAGIHSTAHSTSRSTVTTAPSSTPRRTVLVVVDDSVGAVERARAALASLGRSDRLVLCALVPGRPRLQLHPAASAALPAEVRAVVGRVRPTLERAGRPAVVICSGYRSGRWFRLRADDRDTALRRAASALHASSVVE